MSPQSFIATNIVFDLAKYIHEYSKLVLADFFDIVNYCIFSLEKDDISKFNTVIKTIFNAISELKINQKERAMIMLNSFFTQVQKLSLIKIFTFYDYNVYLPLLFEIFKEAKCYDNESLMVSAIHIMLLFLKNHRSFCMAFLESDMLKSIIKYLSIVFKFSNDKHIQHNRDGTIIIKNEHVCLELLELINYIASGCQCI